MLSCTLNYKDTGTHNDDEEKKIVLDAKQSVTTVVGKTAACRK